VALDDPEPCEEEEKGEPEVGDEGELVADLGDAQHLRTDEDAEHDLDDDRGQKQPDVPAREEGAERRGEDEEDERAGLLPRQVGRDRGRERVAEGRQPAHSGVGAERLGSRGASPGPGAAPVSSAWYAASSASSASFLGNRK